MSLFPNLVPPDRSSLVGFVALSRADKASAPPTAVMPTWAIRPVERGDTPELTARRSDELAARALAARSAGSSGAPTAFSVVESRRSTVVVESLATSAQAKSIAFADGDVVRGGRLQLAIAGSAFDVLFADGASLADVVNAIRGTGAPVDAVVRDDDDGQRIEITGRDSGYAPGGTAAEALRIDESYTGEAGKRLELAITREASNARFSIDGKSYARTTNVVDDVFRGTTLRLETLPRGGAAVAASALPSALPGPQADGVYEVKVESLAQAAQAVSAPFGSPRDRVGAGALRVAAEGKSWTIAVDEGTTLADVAGRIQRSGAPVDATIERADAGASTSYRVRVSARSKGFPIGGVPGDALAVVDDTATSGTGSALGLSVVEAATNARLTVNGRPIESRDNVVRGAVPDVALQLRQQTAATESLGRGKSTVRPADTAGELSQAEIARRLQEQIVELRGKREDARAKPEAAKDDAAARATKSPGPAREQDQERRRSALAEVDVALALESELKPPALGSKTRAKQARQERLLSRYGRDDERAPLPG